MAQSIKHEPAKKKFSTVILVWTFVALIIILSAAWFINQNKKKSDTDITQKDTGSFVGGKECISCHTKEYNLWKNSNHDNAMDVATYSTVLGDFNNAEVTLNSRNHKFYKSDGKFFVNTQGVGGKMTEFEVTHTFGIRPLQMYLVPFEKGKYQCLPVAWDVKKKKWFDMAGMVYKPEDLKPDSWFYWTNQSQNWNGMCADCHSTNLRKNYNLKTDSFNTTWSDIDVNCEACHGPGSKHIEWAKLTESKRKSAGDKGLFLNTSGSTPKQFAESCAPCHSRRTSFGPNNHTDSNYYNNHRPVNITPPLYEADGQILDEDYEFLSFNQSKMHMQGVKCNNCHDPHSLQFKAEGNALCTQCHKSDKYDTFSHHFHKYKNEEGAPVKNKFGETAAVGEGTLCVNCHMAGKYYMGIDFRRDHGIRVPRPDISVKYNTPNACNTCHADKSFQWSADFINKNYGETRKYTYELTLIEGSLHMEGADTSLIRIIKSDKFPEVVKAAAIQYLSEYNNPAALSIIKEMLNSPEPILRERAIDAYNDQDVSAVVGLLVSLLSDPVKMVRVATASKLSNIEKERFTVAQYNLLTKTLEEYLSTLMYTADFPSGKYNLGNFYSDKGDYTSAVKYYNDAIKSDNNFYPAKSNLAMLFYNIGDLEKAETLFLDLIKNHTEYTEGYYYLGLLYGEQKKYKEAASALEKAALADPLNQRIYYNLGLIYQYLNNEPKAESSLLRAYSLSPSEFDIMYALADYYIKTGNLNNAKKYSEEIRKKYPANKDVIKLNSYLEQLTNLKK